jgi:hypothetical protein
MPSLFRWSSFTFMCSRRSSSKLWRAAIYVSPYQATAVSAAQAARPAAGPRCWPFVCCTCELAGPTSLRRLNTTDRADVGGGAFEASDPSSTPFGHEPPRVMRGLYRAVTCRGLTRVRARSLFREWVALDFGPFGAVDAAMRCWAVTARSARRSRGWPTPCRGVKSRARPAEP